MCAKFHCTLLRIKKALGIFRELITTTRSTTTVAFLEPPSGSKNNRRKNSQIIIKLLQVYYDLSTSAVTQPDLEVILGL